MSKALSLAKDVNFKRWFPKHMSKGLIKMKENIRRVDCVIEVHDARIPLSGRNPALLNLLASKPHVVVLNKVDLITATNDQVQRIYGHYKEEGVQKVLFTKCSQCTRRDKFKPIHRSVKKVIPACVEVISNSYRFDREGENDINLMIVGVPNVGKSSLINDIRRHYLRLRPVASVGKLPGHTRSVSFKAQVCDKPSVFLLDTPGIFKAKVESLDEGMKLAVCNTVHDHIMGAPMVAEYLLCMLNDHVQHGYVDFFGLEEPTDCIRTVLRHIASTCGKLHQYNVFTGTGMQRTSLPNYDDAAVKFLSAYRDGNLGKFILDKV